MMDRDNITRTGARAPGVGRCSAEHDGAPTQSGGYLLAAESTKDDANRYHVTGMLGASLTDADREGPV